ncbi:hypothetical protein KQH50_01130 [bacterium]|nr:hypothetical protein [bacterium]
MIRYILSRIGCLAVLVGAIILVVGVSAERSGHPALSMVLGGGALALVGLLLWSKLRPKARRSTRFSMFRRREREKDEEEGYDRWDDRYDL